MGKIVLIVLVFVSGLAAAELSEKFAKRLESADANYQSAVQKADNVRFYAVQKAAQERLKVLKTALADATKAGDFDAATEIKARVAAADVIQEPLTKPKNTIRFGKHEYALITQKATWHHAKRLCEEMGGHLATIESQPEQEFLQKVCGEFGAWMGASDEAMETKWRWVTGAEVPAELVSTWVLNNMDDVEHALCFWPGSGRWEDGIDSHRYYFVCEWD